MRPQPLRKLAPEHLPREKRWATFSEVLPVWKGMKVCCIGGGSSLTLEQVEAVRVAGLPTIAVNDAYLIAPWADVCHFSDREWCEWHTAGVDKPKLGLTAKEVATRFRSFAGQKSSISNSGQGIQDQAVHILRSAAECFGLSTDPNRLRNGRNSGFQAVNIAALAGAAIIILLGYDARVGAQTHWHGGHPKDQNMDAFPLYLESFRASSNDLVAAGVRVINASPGTAIEHFEKLPLELALAA